MVNGYSFKKCNFKYKKNKCRYIAPDKFLKNIHVWADAESDKNNPFFVVWMVDNKTGNDFFNKVDTKGLAAMIAYKNKRTLCSIRKAIKGHDFKPFDYCLYRFVIGY